MSTYRHDRALDRPLAPIHPRIAENPAAVAEFTFTACNDAGAGTMPCFSQMLFGLHPQQMYATLLALDQQVNRLHPDDRLWIRRHEERMRMLQCVRAGQSPSEAPAVTTQVSIPAVDDGVAVGSASRPDLIRDLVLDREHLNQALYRNCTAQLSSHAKRKLLLNTLQERCEAGTANAEQIRHRDCLRTLVQRDERHQPRIDAALLGAVERRCQLIQNARGAAHVVETASDFLETDKGCFLVTPRGIDPFDLEEVAAWMKLGFDRRQAAVRNALVDFQITMADGAEHDREWERYVIRRVCRAIGRDPDLHVFAATHEPDRHAPSKKDGKPVQPHIHVAVLTCNQDGSVWQVRNLHLVVQRELEAINHERGWGQLTTSAVAKGRQAWWYSEKGAATRIGWTTITRTARTFTATDSPECVLDVASEAVPAEGWRRPGAGIFVFNAQESPKRERLRRRDQRRFADAQATVDQLLGSCGQLGIVLPRDDGGRILLQYFSATSVQDSSLKSRLCHAVVRRDAAANAVLARRILYFSG